jgi:hypothetical protein
MAGSSGRAVYATAVLQVLEDTVRAVNMIAEPLHTYDFQNGLYWTVEEDVEQLYHKARFRRAQTLQVGGS